MHIPILYEDNDVLVINKPSGLMVHADGRSTDATLVDWILNTYPTLITVGEPGILHDGKEAPRPGIVHRIDKDTSGVLIIAKTPESFAFLKESFKNREVKKQYAAFVYGSVKEKYDVINRPIGKSKKDPRMWSAQRGARGTIRDAITEYRVRARVPAQAGDTGVTYLEVRPKTGRTHQIRVHMKAINHPIVCDTLYAPKMPPVLGFERLALHAEKISFTSVSGKEIVVEAPLPEDFIRAQKVMKTA